MEIPSCEPCLNNAELTDGLFYYYPRGKKVYLCLHHSIKIKKMMFTVFELKIKRVKMQTQEPLDSQEEEITCPHCHSEKLEHRSKMVACATMREPAVYEGWFYCWECGEESEAGE